MRALLIACLLIVPLSLTACGGDPAGKHDAEAAGITALEGGKPLPDGPLTIGFPWIGKQSIMCVGDAVERQVAFVDFTDGTPNKVGTVEVADASSASGRFVVPIEWLLTGHESRDEKLKNHGWLDVEKQPDLVLECTKMTRVKPTVWRVEGSWSMKGVTNAVAFHANVRYVGEMKRVGSRVVRVKASFPIALRDFEIVNPAVGTPAVADSWTVDVVLLGVITN